MRSADLVQDLYLRELRAFKPAPTKASDADAYVQKFNAPKTPPSPEEGNIAAELKAYERLRDRRPAESRHPLKRTGWRSKIPS
jgi:hypothetical protein